VPPSVTEILAHLVAIPSVNPMGRDVAGPPFLESRLTDHLETLLRSFGLAVERQPVHPGRENLVGRLDGAISPDEGGEVLLLDAHQDTVPVEGMTIEPFKPEIRDGRLYGRGACDTKGGMAAAIVAIARLAEDRPQGMPTVLMAFTVNEECGFTGARAAAELCRSAGPGSIVPRRPDGAVVLEPTGLEVVVAHKGMVRWRCSTRGRAAHSSQPEAGQNAIYRMAGVLQAIEGYARDMAGSLAGHPICGPATLSVGTIRGGVSVNTVPDRCTIELDRRLPPGEDPDEARQGLIDHLTRVLGSDFPIEHEPPYLVGLPLSDEHNAMAAERLARAVRAVTRQCRQTGVPYGTDAADFAAAGVPTVVFGPGHLAQAHTVDEWIALSEVEQAAEILYRFCAGGGS
jgi:acetylornithine deacetylase/succinyl-diaminopimelate desuccinylase family protein